MFAQMQVYVIGRRAEQNAASPAAHDRFLYDNFPGSSWLSHKSLDLVLLRSPSHQPCLGVTQQMSARTPLICQGISKK